MRWDSTSGVQRRKAGVSEGWHVSYSLTFHSDMANTRTGPLLKPICRGHVKSKAVPSKLKSLPTSLPQNIDCHLFLGAEGSMMSLCRTKQTWISWRLRLSGMQTYNSVNTCYFFGGNPCLQFEGRRCGDTEDGSNRFHLNFLTLRLEVSGFPKRWYLFTRLLFLISQKSVILRNTHFAKNMICFVIYV
jgi:hypothetical protein